MGKCFVNLKKKLKIVRSKNFFTYRSGSKDDCNNKSEKKMSSKKTSSGEMSSDAASGSRILKSKVDEISSNKSSKLEVDQNTCKVPKLLSPKTDTNLKGKHNVRGKKTNNFSQLCCANNYIAVFSSK